MIAFRAFLNFSMLQECRERVEHRGECGAIAAGLVPQGGRDLEPADLAAAQEKCSIRSLGLDSILLRFLSALTFSNVTMPTFVLPQVAALSKNGFLAA